MSRITGANDAYGHELWTYLTEGRPDEIVERDDGLITCGEGPKRYFSGFSAWAKREQRAMRFTQGSRALDVGLAQAGCHSIFSARAKVTAIDRSPLAIRLCRKRGVQDARLLPIEQIKGPWFDYLLVSPSEMKGILAGTGWALRTLLRSSDGPPYVAVIAKTLE